MSNENMKNSLNEFVEQTELTMEDIYNAIHEYRKDNWQMQINELEEVKDLLPEEVYKKILEDIKSGA